MNIIDYEIKKDYDRTYGTISVVFCSNEEAGKFRNKFGDTVTDYTFLARNPGARNPGDGFESADETAKEIKKLKKKISDKEKRIKDLETEIEKLNDKWIETKAKDFESPIGSLEI